eukprot:TRINITY_DN7033_c0_g4_i1.p1 TRINITY_DN7033_c0_g4~~TRINITY_DN7033_c0_g4_i1.p1  ORF type:complete len:214 (+),score=37.60 TRINITY_DN7033_c0_g4_i1:195-836(+)
MENQFNIESEDPFQTLGNDLLPEQFSLPYHWDEECHLILNEDYYLRSPEPELLELHETPSSEFPEDISLERANEPELIKTDLIKIDLTETDKSKLIKADELELIKAKDSACSEASGSTTGTVEVPERLPKRTKTLDDQLDFIMGTCQKHNHSNQEKVPKRNRKTPEQIITLIEILGEVPKKVTRRQLKAAAAKTGLTELQVYKWHYDRKCRLN